MPVLDFRENMGDIRYFILDRVNGIRDVHNRARLAVHEENSNASQKHAQYILEEMLRYGLHRFVEIGHFNPYRHGEYIAENIAFSFNHDSPIGRNIEGMLRSFENERGMHWQNILGPFNHLGTDIAYDGGAGLLVLVQRFN